MRLAPVVLAPVVLASSLVIAGCRSEPSLAQAGAALAARAHAVHFAALVVDTHVDTTQSFIGQPDFDLGERHAVGAIDIPRMRAGGLDAVFFSIWVDGKVTGPEAVQRALVQIDAVREQVRARPRDLALCTTADEVRRANARGQIAVLLGVEGGHMIAGDLGVLRSFAALGVRYLTLTHSLAVEWADSSTDTPRHDGLSPFGEQVVRELNRLGVLVDISHVSDATFADALAVSEAPLIASHSGCRALADAPRNMSDDMIRALAARGGVIQIPYHIGFLSQEYRDAGAAQPQLMDGWEERIEAECGGKDPCALAAWERLTRELVDAGKLPRVSWERIVDHIDHAVRLVGPDHVGLGSDFDGANMPYGMEDASQLPRITEALMARGYSTVDVRKILGGNTLRLMAEVEAVAAGWRARDATAAPDRVAR